jgi:hypothetical protein
MRIIHKSSTVFLVLLMAVAILASFSALHPTYAQLVKDHGASGFAPKADPDAAAGGWQPMEAPGKAPDLAAENNPGQKGLLAGIIGPDIKE